MYGLPNKLFEYCFSGIPVLGSNLIEMKTFINKYNIGWIVDTDFKNTDNLKIFFNSFLEENIEEKIKNSLNLSNLISWEKEEKKLESVYKKLYLIKNF